MFAAVSGTADDSLYATNDESQEKVYFFSLSRDRSNRDRHSRFVLVCAE